MIFSLIFLIKLVFSVMSHSLKNLKDEDKRLVSITRIPKITNYSENNGTIVSNSYENKPTTYVYYTNTYANDIQHPKESIPKPIPPPNNNNTSTTTHSRQLSPMNTLTDDIYFDDYEKNVKQHIFIYILLIIFDKLLINGTNIYLLIITYKWISLPKYDCSNIFSLYNWWYTNIILIVLHYLLFIYITLYWIWWLKYDTISKCSSVFFIISLLIYLISFYSDSISVTLLNIMLIDNTIINYNINLILKYIRFMIRGIQIVLYPIFIMLYPRLKGSFIVYFICSFIISCCFFISIEFILPVVTQRNICIAY